MSQLLYANQFVVTELNVGGGIDASQTTGIIISDVSKVDTTKPGIAILNWSDPVDSTLAEWIEYTSINGSKEFVGVTRGAEGYSAKTHSNGVSVAFPVSESHINRIAEKLNGNDTGVVLASPTLTTPAVTSPTFSGTIDGWISATGTWSYASATTITVPSGAASIYQVGDKIKFTQTTVKYAYITTVADTLLTIRAGSDYSVANAAITSPYYSHETSPLGFPTIFNFGGTFSTSGSAFTNAPTIGTARFSMHGQNAYLYVTFTFNATSGGTGFVWLTPTANQLPTFSYGALSAANYSDQIALLAWTDGTKFILAKVDGTTCIANSKFVGFQGLLI